MAVFCKPFSVHIKHFCKARSSLDIYWQRDGVGGGGGGAGTEEREPFLMT